jgi:hypothetical protein
VEDMLRLVYGCAFDSGSFRSQRRL